MRLLLWDIKYVGLAGIPYMPVRFDVGNCTIGISRLWCGFRKRMLCTGRPLYPFGFLVVVVGKVK